MKKFKCDRLTVRKFQFLCSNRVSQVTANVCYYIFSKPSLKTVNFRLFRHGTGGHFSSADVCAALLGTSSNSIKENSKSFSSILCGELYSSETCKYRCTNLNPRTRSYYDTKAVNSYNEALHGTVCPYLFSSISGHDQELGTLTHSSTHASEAATLASTTLAEPKAADKVYSVSGRADPDQGLKALIHSTTQALKALLTSAYTSYTAYNTFTLIIHEAVIGHRIPFPTCVEKAPISSTTNLIEVTQKLEHVYTRLRTCKLADVKSIVNAADKPNQSNCISSKSSNCISKIFLRLMFYKLLEIALISFCWSDWALWLSNIHQNPYPKALDNLKNCSINSALTKFLIDILVLTALNIKTKLTALKIKTKLKDKLVLPLYKTHLFDLFQTHRCRKSHEAFKRDRLKMSGDVEENPGPGSADDRQQRKEANILVTSYNVRGLNDEKKLRHLINKIYKEGKGKDFDSIVCLQESYITNLGKLPYLWRGNLHLTPGTGSSCGCITLTSSHLSIAHSVDLDGRAHILALQKSNENNISYILANVYAPNPNNAEKIDFFDRLFDTVSELEERFDCSNVIMAGDFNLIFETKEAKNRLYTAQERRIAEYVKDQMISHNLKDSWEGKTSFTWRRPNTDIFSRIDRVLFARDSFELVRVKDNWSYSYSDHAAVIAGLKLKSKTNLTRSRITRLDPSLTKSQHYGNLVVAGFNSMIETMPIDWNPHLKLEFAKMCIRTVVEKVQAERKTLESTEEKQIDEELDTAISKLVAGDQGASLGLIDHIEELRARKQCIIEEKGARLAEKLGTKWFNEGEKSTRYFLRLLNRAKPDNFEILVTDNGDIISKPEEVEEAIVQFYKKLYEETGNVVIENDPTFFDQINPVSDEDDDHVANPLNKDDLWQTLKTCSDSAPGPDGIPYSFIKLLWPIFGDILCKAWQYSLDNQCLPPSHKKSYLKLIPKAGKDLKRLTNWRPITLSNCDHKLITKTYAKKLCERVAAKISGSQTAYLKNRLINDNVRAIISSINLTNVEDNLCGILVSLDAKKAFDSVDHNYIEKCLLSFGLRKFVPIFRTLYRDLSTDIIVNGRIVSGFKIKRGVKQGDALSCILFILCMEPLLKNVDVNQVIAPLNSAELGCELPKTYAYADDMSCIIKDSDEALQAIFDEYERLTKMSGLELNADKTELMRLGNEEPRTYNVNYRRQIHNIDSLSQVKINGILFQNNFEVMVRSNVDNVVSKMDRQFKAWNRRSLSTVGKILIAKTFGVSQAIYLMQSVSLKDEHYKKMNAVLYKFIWNRNYHAAKAPERVKREIVTSSTRNGGYGMIDIAELDNSLKLRALGRARLTEHPFLKIMNAKLNLDSYFTPKIDLNLTVDSVLTEGVKILKNDRDNLWGNGDLDRDRKLLAAIRGTKILEIIEPRGKASMAFFQIWARGARKIGDLNRVDLDRLSRFINRNKVVKLQLAVSLNLVQTDLSFNETYYVAKQHKLLGKISSKDFRTSRSKKSPILNLKLGVILTQSESMSWGLRLTKLTSAKHRNTILRVSHGDVYTQEKLHRFGLSDSDKCPRCDQVETLRHKILECDYARRIWHAAIPMLRKLQDTFNPNPEPDKTAIAASVEASTASMTLTAELLLSILFLKRDQNHLMHPKFVVMRAIKNLAIKEGNNKIKVKFIEIVNDQ